MYNTETCVKECKVGLFEMKNLTELSCGTCDESCLGCSNSTCCTSCNEFSKNNLLHGCNCVERCPEGHTNIKGVCRKCESPCKECSTSTDLCTKCDGTDNKLFLFQGKCYDTCKEGTSLNPNTNKCETCNIPGCASCDFNNLDSCTKCALGSLLLNGTICVNECPLGYKEDIEQINCLLIPKPKVKVALAFTGVGFASSENEGNDYVSDNTNLRVNLVRQPGGVDWQLDQCF